MSDRLPLQVSAFLRAQTQQMLHCGTLSCANGGMRSWRQESTVHWDVPLPWAWAGTAACSRHGWVRQLLQQLPAFRGSCTGSWAHLQVSSHTVQCFWKPASAQQRAL